MGFSLCAYSVYGLAVHLLHEYSTSLRNIEKLIVTAVHRRHVVFGRVIGESLLVLRKIENVQTGPNNKPKMQVAITECGEM